MRIVKNTESETIVIDEVNVGDQWVILSKRDSVIVLMLNNDYSGFIPIDLLKNSINETDTYDFDEMGEFILGKMDVGFTAWAFNDKSDFLDKQAELLQRVGK